jgi:predicted acylesterase/phospholipase RssA/CRP-like cAMP-binding protein
MLRDLDRATLHDLAAAFESVHVRGGERVLKCGQRNVPFIAIVHGGLRATFVDMDGERHPALERFRGGTFGETFLLADKPFPFDLDAVRDTHLLVLTPDRFRALVAKHPEVGVHLGRVAANDYIELITYLRMPEFRSVLEGKADRIPRSVVLLDAGGQETSTMRDLLAQCLAGSCRATRLGLADARKLVQGNLEEGGADVEGRLAEWLGQHESRADVMLFECSASDGAWVDFCLRQADRIVVLAGEDIDHASLERGLWRTANLGGRSARVELAIVHGPKASMPRGGAAYLGLPCLRRLHHVRAGSQDDAARLARWVADRPVGLVLGGGGAFGIAHVGVIKALEECRVPVDIIGGTSMGAIFGGGLARGWSADALMCRVRKLFKSRFALYDPTIPLKALLAGKKLDRVLRGFFEGIEFADLWTPFFCISTNISRPRREIHTTGNVWAAIRSSCSIPGLFPPLELLKQLFVDGGVVDNLPIDVMAEQCHGAVIAVDVHPHGHAKPEPSRESSESESSDGSRRRTSHRPQLFDILMHSTLVGSDRLTAMALASHPPALHLVPPLSEFSILDWRAFEALYEAGYTCAKREIEAGKLPRRLWEGRLEELAH